jgi:TRAP-type C4-dicarboxylate transport system permease large subunit
VLGGIYGGIFTPIEAAAVAAVYAFFITVFVYKELRLSMRYARFHFAVSGSSPERANQVSITAGNLRDRGTAGTP